MGEGPERAAAVRAPPAVTETAAAEQKRLTDREGLAGAGLAVCKDAHVEAVAA